ncbi:3-isopropylmalate dehydratase small subunit [Hyphococcus flavus]|uniref:3-isopropylmalate dehydratase n=1 Tax=Hyphococcus flavus TaxID=1866326 RepID=A0AAE9ZAS2_9PROT|nr:3-isopropylmalate dehydratase small subunit [Hyphococcus flavus]WDI30859.1 3-isopropylmalate dehydratase small subunit [Hyphococcus flavus]
MSFEPFNALTSRTVVLRQENIDTDQIIPARFLTTTSKEGLGESVFFDWRYEDDGKPRNSSIFNGYNPDTHKILVAGSNFGCGSSREHAPWALYGFGFRAVISSDIADIFKSNALKNGLLAIEVDPKTHASLLNNPGAEIEIDLERQVVALSVWEKAHFDIEPFARQCLMNGVDQLGHLQNKLAEIEAYEAACA